jgi:glutaminyl-peptide cyclotransferase
MTCTIRNIVWLFCLSGLLISGCVRDGKKTTEWEKDSVVELKEVPVFNADSAYHFMEQQVAFGPRVPGTSAWEKCAVFLSEMLGRYGAEVIVQEATARAWNGQIIPIKNIIGSWQPENKKRVMLCAHWDSRPYADWDPDEKNHRKPIDGANDGASGVGVLLEVARQLSISQPNVGIDIIFFDTEDYGEPKDDQSKIKDDNWGLGSQHWAKNPHKKNYYARFGILLDMVGAKDAIFYQEGYSVHYAEHIVRKVWDIAHKIGYGKLFSFEKSNHITDDHYYVNLHLGLPTINIIHQDKSSKTGFFKYWHTVEDTMDKISKESLEAVGQTVLYVIYNE